MKILVADPADPTALEYFQSQKIAFDYLPKITAEELTTVICNYDALMVRSRTKVTKDVLDCTKRLKVVARIGSGYDNIDIDTCQRKSISIVNAPDANSIAVAELTVGLIISFLREVPRAVLSMKEGLWIKDEIWGGEINGKTVGILGYGHVGKRVAHLLRAFGAKVLIHSRTYQTATLRGIFQKSDIVSVHMSLNKETKGFITAWLLSQMKATSIFANLSRGEIVDEDALYDTLKNKKIRGAILDVFWKEPLPSESRWRTLDNVLLTPHIGAASTDALKRASITVAEDIVRVLHGEKPHNHVI